MLTNRLIGLAVVSTFVSVAFLTTGVASATVLCGTTPSAANDCGINWQYHTGQIIDASVETSTTLKTTGGTTIATCTQGTIKGEISQEGATVSTVVISIETHTKSNCNTTVDTLANGSWEIHHIAGTDNGTITSNGTKITINFLGASCVFETKNTDFGTLTGGNPATIDVSATIPGISGGLCPSSGVASGSYRLTEPPGTLHVAAG